MYIAPNSEIRCLAGVPIDNTYRNTLWFDTIQAQETYFLSKTKLTFTAQSYQRANRGFLRINAPVAQLYNCNYLMFKNTAFDNKWFYAFITNVEYVNNVTSRVEYALDVMQTWFFDYSLGVNYVSREHIVIDAIGANLIPEGLETGEYIVNPTTYGDIITQWNLVFACTFDYDLNDSQGKLIGQTYSGITLVSFPLNHVIPDSGNSIQSNINAINDFIDRATTAGKIEQIVGVYMIPYTNNGVSTYGGTPSSSGGQTIISVPKNQSQIDGYIPKNNKLFTYPYNFLMCNTQLGTSGVLKYEFFSDANCRILKSGSTAINSENLYVPINYKGKEYNWDEKFVMPVSCQCAFNVDAYKAYVAQSLVAYLGNQVYEIVESSPVGSLLDPNSSWINEIPRLSFEENATSGNGGHAGGGAGRSGRPETEFSRSDLVKAKSMLAMASAMGGFNSVYKELQGMYSKYIQAPHSVGSTDFNTLINMNVFGFRINQMHITNEFARSIDGFFNMFGYATHQLKIPNRHSRPHWNYVQLKNTHIEGAIPFEHESAICSIYDNGITFWKNPAEVGDYSLDNRPT